MFPKLWEADGIASSELLQQIVDLANWRQQNKQNLELTIMSRVFLRYRHVS